MYILCQYTLKLNLSKLKLNTKTPTGWSFGGLSFLHSSLPVSTLSDMVGSWSWPAGNNYIPKYMSLLLTQPFGLAFMEIQDKLNKLILELGRGPGSLYSEIVEGPLDLEAYPETQWDAHVRLGDDLCLSERAFLRERKRKMRVAFAKLLEVPLEQVDERDIPIVAIAGTHNLY